MGKKRMTLREELVAEYFRHHLAHGTTVAAGGGCRGCQFCPTLKVRAGRPRRGFMRPGIFPQRFLRELARDVNKIKRMAGEGHSEANRFMEHLERLLKGKPWDDPPPSPAATLSVPMIDQSEESSRIASMA